jgi:S-adenosylmethionine:tRNA ribosyltransferase-isomerase
MVDSDVERYQTVFARRPGAVAAPTAGLHFTEPLIKRLVDRGVNLSAVTLHVGWGTFRPIQSSSLDEHVMHEEWGELSAAAAKELNETRAAGGRVIAVGTTVVRLLESVTRDAVGPNLFSPWSGTTGLFIRPPFQFRAVDAVLTNFHFPRTTLLVLVQTFGGRELIRNAYAEAIREEYRFYSYGDAMLIL